MTAYVPILKSKEGEREALWYLTAPAVEVRPVLELTPPNGDEDDDRDNGDKGKRKLSPAQKLNKQLENVANLVRDRLPAGVVAAVDTVYVDGLPYADDPWKVLVAWLTERLEPSPVRPVFRLNDPASKLARVAEVITEFGQGGCLRLEVSDADRDLRAVAAKVPGVLKAVGQDPAGIDLIIDLGAVGSDPDVSRALQAARIALEWAGDRPWRSLTVASGAFPKSLQGLPTDGVAALPRRDARLWCQLRDERPARSPDFGDYGIAHPALGGAKWPSTPNLRYTAAGDWQVYRQRTPLDLGHERFCRICQQVIESDHFPLAGEAFSWGDKQIGIRARDCTNPGNPSKWRGFGTSHHMAVVIDRLARLDEP